MELQLDHIVHFIHPHPNEAVNVWKELGYHAVIGGSHENWGTFNSLLYVGDAYIEYLAIENTPIASISDNPLISQLMQDLPNGEGISQICFRTSDINNVKKQLEERGCQTYSIFNGSRKRQDGQIIKWKMLFIKDNTSLPNPFFIEWAQTNESRMKELEALNFLDRRLVEHKIQTIQIAVNNCEETANKWAELFNFSIIGISTEAQTATKKAKIQGAGVEILFCQPLNEENTLHNKLNQRGERPFEIQFKPTLDCGPITIFGSDYK